MFRADQSLSFQKCIGVSSRLIFSHINFLCGSGQSLFLSKQLKIFSFSTEIRLLIYIAIYVGIPVVDQNPIMQGLYKHRQKKTCLVCQIGSYLLGHLVQSPTVKGMNCFEFHLGKYTSLLSLVLLQGCFRNSLKIQNFCEEQNVVSFHTKSRCLSSFSYITTVWGGSFSK